MQNNIKVPEKSIDNITNDSKSRDMITKYSIRLHAAAISISLIYIAGIIIAGCRESMKEAEYKLLPHTHIIDSIYVQNLHALDETLPNYHFLKDSLKRDRDEKLESIADTYRENGLLTEK